MRRFNILFAFAAIMLTSCVVDDVDFTGSYNPSSKGGIHIVGAVEDFDVKTVGTRADDGDIADSYISEMTMFIFKGDGNLIQGYTDATFTTECTSAINIQRGNPTFLIDTEEGILADLSGTSDTNIVYYNNNADDLGACDIYIVANAWHQLSAGEVGNRPVDKIKSLADLKAFVYEADGTLAMPMIDESNPRGFPMIGKQNGGSFKLKKGDDNEGNAVATIPLKKLYSKVRFTMQINANQVVAGQTPKFSITKAEVFNVPKMARLGRDVYEDGEKKGELIYDDHLTEMGVNDTTEPEKYYYYVNTTGTEPYTITEFKDNKKTISHSTSATTDDIIEFGFYMPEHMVTPNTITYPDKITDEAKQYYKPAGVGQSRNGDGTISSAKIATFVRIHGTYTDHNGQILGVKYDIYLGQNNSDDFTIKRNQLLNNKLIITGLTNHKDAYPDTEGNISIDHRVEIEDKGFNLSMERTAILDSHFEVRPLDIELSPNSQMIITIPEDDDKDYRSWIAMEDDAAARSSVNSGLYVNTSTPRKGVRKYFTTNLVSELNAANGNGGTITLSNNETGATTTKTFRIWFYIDENPNVYDKLDLGKQTSETGTYTVSKEQYRVCPVQFSYSGTDKDGNTTTKSEKINFQQWNLWRVWSAPNANGVRERYYDIEHEEEYLNNYASDQQYGGTQNGMPFGLEGVQLSNKVLAYWLEKVEHKTGATGLGAVINWIVSGLDGLFNISNSSESIFAKSGKEPYYDFYLSRDGFPIDKLDSSVDKTDYVRDYMGIEFNKKIAKTLRDNYASQQVAHGNSQGYSAQIEKLNLTQDPSSAFAYCYHKNKRNSNGDVVEQKWFLPAIDEIEDIALGAYDEFDKVFQNQKYWSCQPAYERNLIVIEPASSKIDYYKYNTLEGDFFNDNTSRARATSIYTDGRGYSNIMSSIPDNVESGKLTSRVNVKVSIGLSGTTVTQNGDPITDWDSSVVDYSDPVFANPNGEYRGNSPRTEKCRIRAVYRSGTK